MAYVKLTWQVVLGSLKVSVKLLESLKRFKLKLLELFNNFYFQNVLANCVLTLYKRTFNWTLRFYKLDRGVTSVFGYL